MSAQMPPADLGMTPKRRLRHVKKRLKALAGEGTVQCNFRLADENEADLVTVAEFLRSQILAVDVNNATVCRYALRFTAEAIRAKLSENRESGQATNGPLQETRT